MKKLTRDGLRDSLARALANDNAQTDALSQDAFSADYPERPGWEVGPFRRDPALTFTLDTQWADPHDIGWTSSSIFNPTVIEHEGVLHLFYRASPVKESVASRIGHATRDADGVWTDSPANPVIFETLDNELLGCEDPKIYRADGRFHLFYNGIFPVDEADRLTFPSPGWPIGDIGCDINLAVSDDLRTWRKLGRVVPHEVSRLWAKGAVIPRDASGAAVKINGEYLMFVSEGCDGRLVVGHSDDLMSWTFTDEPYLDLSSLDGHLHEVASAIVDDGRLVLDVFYGERDHRFAAAQARYDLDRPFDQLALHRGGALPWGGLIRHPDTWLLAQGWDAAPNERQIIFYRG
jgi:beta-1,2-mannosidase